MKTLVKAILGLVGGGLLGGLAGFLLILIAGVIIPGGSDQGGGTIIAVLGVPYAVIPGAVIGAMTALYLLFHSSN